MYRAAQGRGMVTRAVFAKPGSSPVSTRCGGCLACTTSRANVWALRALVESSLHESVIFATLTYRDESLPRPGGGAWPEGSRLSRRPRQGTLREEDVDRFLERARHRFGPFRYLLVGEYGPNGSRRPHYHALFFGLKLHDVSDVVRKQRVFQRSHELETVWGFGEVLFLPSTFERVLYATQYAASKLQGKHLISDLVRFEPFEKRERVIVAPPFQKQSTKPGLGFGCLDDESVYGQLVREGTLACLANGEYPGRAPKPILAKVLRAEPLEYIERRVEGRLLGDQAKAEGRTLTTSVEIVNRKRERKLAAAVASGRPIKLNGQLDGFSEARTGPMLMPSGHLPLDVELARFAGMAPTEEAEAVSSVESTLPDHEECASGRIPASIINGRHPTLRIAKDGRRIEFRRKARGSDLPYGQADRDLFLDRLPSSPVSSAPIPRRRLTPEARKERDLCRERFTRLDTYLQRLVNRSVDLKYALVQPEPSRRALLAAALGRDWFDVEFDQADGRSGGVSEIFRPLIEDRPISEADVEIAEREIADVASKIEVLSRSRSYFHALSVGKAEEQVGPERWPLWVVDPFSSEVPYFEAERQRKRKRAWHRKWTSASRFYHQSNRSMSWAVAFMRYGPGPRFLKPAAWPDERIANEIRRRATFMDSGDDGGLYDLAPVLAPTAEVAAFRAAYEASDATDIFTFVPEGRDVPAILSPVRDADSAPATGIPLRVVVDESDIPY